MSRLISNLLRVSEDTAGNILYFFSCLIVSGLFYRAWKIGWFPHDKSAWLVPYIFGGIAVFFLVLVLASSEFKSWRNIMKSKIIIAALGFIILGGVGYYLYTHSYLLKQPSVPFSIQREASNPNQYSIILPKGGWYDTGVWVPVDYKVSVGVPNVNRADAINQPFSMMLGGKEFRSWMNSGDNSFVVAVTATRGPEEPYKAHVDKEEKVWLKLDNEATTEKIDLLLTIYDK